MLGSVLSFGDTVANVTQSLLIKMSNEGERDICSKMTVQYE